MKIDLNGNVLDEKQAVVSVYDHGFLYGMGLFETFRTYNGCPFLLEWHLERLEESCRELDIRYVPDVLDIQQRVARLLAENDMTDAYFRLTVTAGTEELGLPSDIYKRPNEIIYIKPLPSSNPDVYLRGKALQRLQLRRNTPEGMIRNKSLHYMNNILAKKEMRNYPWASGAEGLFLEERDYLSEGIVSNLFFVKEGKLYTPSLENGILPGITRKWVMHMATKQRIDLSEGLFRWEDLLQADEVFLTNSIQEIVPVTTLFDLDGSAYMVGEGSVGPITLQMLSLYRAEVNHTASTHSETEGRHDDAQV